MYGLIGAMAVEVENLLAHMENKKETVVGMDHFWSGTLYGQEAVLAVCGPGKVNAALCAQNMITAFHPTWVLNLGVAGGGDDTMSIGDMVVADCAVQHDMDTSPIGDPKGLVSKINLVQIPCDADLHAALVRAARQVEGCKVYEGVIATGDQFICTEAEKERIKREFQAVAMEMEGAAVAHACYMNQVPCGVLRSISDGANSDSTMDYPAFTRLAAGHSEQVIRHLFAELGR